jgi:predicted metal-dependent hydrolase
MDTRKLYREQEFATIDEISEQIARDYYGNDLDSLISVFQELRYTVDEWLTRAKDNGVVIPSHWSE